MWKFVGVFAVVVVLEFEVGSGSLCQRCSCYSGGIVNCAGKDLERVPVFTPDDIGRIGVNGIISFKDNRDLTQNGDRLEKYFPYISSFEFDAGSPLCPQIVDLASSWTGVRVYGCSFKTTQTTQRSTEYEEVSETEKRNIPSEREENAEVKSLKKSWVVNTVFGWIGLVVSAVTTSLILRCCYLRRNGERNVQMEVQRIRAFLRRYYGQRRLREFGINLQFPGDELHRPQRRRADDILYAPPLQQQEIPPPAEEQLDEQDEEVILRPPVM